MAYAVIVNKIDKFVWIVSALIIGEGIVFLLYKKICPLIIIARKYSVLPTANFDIYPPDWLAKYSKQIFTTFFIIIVCGIIYRLINQYL